jgi:hypothetical protein
MDKRMNNERFEQLKASIIEAGIILQGKQKPSREFQFKVVNKPNNLEELWAICLESDDAKLLIPRKLYLVKFGENGVWVRDEAGEMTVCDKEDFLPLAFTPEVEELLAIAA